jgi:hypothetical protein
MARHGPVNLKRFRNQVRASVTGIKIVILYASTEKEINIPWGELDFCLGSVKVIAIFVFTR